jgi:hypothetical protein
VKHTLILTDQVFQMQEQTSSIWETLWVPGQSYTHLANHRWQVPHLKNGN